MDCTCLECCPRITGIHSPNDWWGSNTAVTKMGDMPSPFSIMIGTRIMVASIDRWNMVFDTSAREKYFSLEVAELHEGVLDAPLYKDKDHQQDDREYVHWNVVGECVAGCIRLFPAVKVAARQEEHRGRGHQQDRADVVDGYVAFGDRLRVAAKHRHAGLDDDQADGQHGEEHQPPAGKLKEQPENRQADEAPHPRARNRKGIGPAPFLRWKGERQHGVPVAVNQPGSQSLQAPKRDHLGQVLGGEDHHRAQRDDDGPDEEDFGVSEPVAQPRP